MAKIFIKTLGCKVNSYDSSQLLLELNSLGYERAAAIGEADIILINSCCVTANAEKEVKYLMRRYRRSHPGALLGVIGCYTRVTETLREQLDSHTVIITARMMPEIANAVDEAYQKRITPSALAERGVLDSPASPLAAPLIPPTIKTQQRTRYFLKVQDGCESFCSYCIVPFVRGPSCSVPLKKVKAAVVELIASGVKEIVLTGVHIGYYGKDLAEFKGHPEPLAELLGELLTLPNMGRIRLSSIEPNEVSEGLLKLVAQYGDSFCDHFHLPLQSGSPKILKLMQRPYLREEYVAKIELIRSYFPEAFIGTDVICGFPQETSKEFDETIELLKRVQPSAVHVFGYSPRPQTAAATMTPKVPPEVLKERVKGLIKLSEGFFRAYQNAFVGKQIRVVWENSFDPQGQRIGRSSNYLEVVLKGGIQQDQGQLSWVELTGISPDGKLIGVPIPKAGIVRKRHLGNYFGNTKS